MSLVDTNLARKMLNRADEDNLPDDHDLRVKALEFEDAVKGYMGKQQTHTIKQFFGGYARAKMAWSNYTGEPLI